MISSRRQLLAIALVLSCGSAAAQKAWPSAKPIRIIVPGSAGAQADILARLVGQAIGVSLDTTVVVEVKPGAHGLIGGLEAAKSPPDGYTLMVLGGGAVAANPKLYGDRMPFDMKKDFAPVSLLITVPVGLVVNPHILSVKSVPEFVSYLKANPGKVNYASSGSGGTQHLTAEYFKYRTGTHMTHIPYRGQSPAMADVVAGHVPVMFDTFVGMQQHIRSGKLQLLAVTTPQRLPEYPNVPTIAEALGLRDFEASSWTGLYAPSGTPPDIVKRLSAEIDIALKSPAVAKRLAELGAVPVGGTPARLAEFQRIEEEKWGRVIDVAKIKPD